MKLDKMVPTLKAMIVLFAAQTAFGADGTWVQREGVGTGGTNWADWFDVENWERGVVAGDYGQAMLAGAMNQYINISSSVSVLNLNGSYNGYAVLRSDETIQIKATKPAEDPRYVWLYAPYSMYTPAGENYAGLDTLRICGPAVSQLSGTLPSRGATYFCFDCFAESAGETRTVNAVPAGLRPDVDARMYFVAPHGSDTNSVSAWSQTAGSPFLAPVGGAVAHALSVGTTVTGEGIPEDTFLKRVFPDGTIELSAAATMTVEGNEGNELTFSAFTAKTFVRSVGFQAFNSAGCRYINVEKYRTADELTVTGALSYVSNKNTSEYTVDTREGYYPGVLCLPADTSYAKVTLRNARLAFAGDQPAKHLYVDKAASSPELIVAGGKAFAVSGLEQLKGTLVKKGAGKLTLEVLATTVADMSGSMTVAEGTLALLIADGAVRSVDTLTVKSGARFDVPASGIVCDVLDVEDGAVIGGSGVLTYRTLAGGTMPAIVVKGSAVVRAETPEEEDFSVRVLSGAYTAYTKDGNDVLVFDSSATVAVAGTGTVSMLVVGGGGGGGQYRGGGGGGGGVIETNDVVLVPGVYALTVGNGGAAAVGNASGLNGEASTAFGVTALGGGGGGTRKAGSDGGSGGGGGAPAYSTNATNSFGLGTAGQGYEGSKGVAQASHWVAAGGGGGGAGQPALPYRLTSNNRGVGGRGGDGKLSSIWIPQYYGGGGNGGSATANYEHKRAGRGGGGRAGAVNNSGVVVANGEPGVDGLGGGGGGGGDFVETHAPAGRGGRGTVILCVANPHSDYVLPEPAGCATGGDQIRHRHHHWIHTFTNDASFVLTQGVFADVLLVGGGGGGVFSGGGGGGGAVVAITNLYLPAGTYPIVIGKGGIGSSGITGIATGGTSTTLTQQDGTISLLALGGGAGGTRNLGGNGGPGGGGGADSDPGSGYVGGEDVLGPSPSGGHSTNATSSVYSRHGGGGAGAGQPGADATESRGGDGGDGVAVDFSGTLTYYGGGGGGGSAKTGEYPTAGGEGGGGNGSGIRSYPNCYNAENGTDGFGGGGSGGASAGDGVGKGGNGGCGCVIIRYAVQPTGLMIMVR